MKVALCYTGLLRSWQQCKGNHYDNVWVGNKPDFYFYTDKSPIENLEERESVLLYTSKIVYTQDQNIDWYPDPFKPHLYNNGSNDRHGIWY